MTDLDSDPNVKRATSDYLAVCQGRDLFNSPDDYERAEQRAWDALVEALGDRHLADPSLDLASAAAAS
jgi:hypothetical protein